MAIAHRYKVAEICSDNCEKLHRSNGSHGQARICKDFQISRRKDFDCVLLLRHNVLQILYAGTVTMFKISYPMVFKELLGRNKLYDSLTFIDVDLTNLFTLLLVRASVQPSSLVRIGVFLFYRHQKKRLEGKVF